MRDVLLWSRSKLRSAVINDITKDFCDGTVLMELVVVLCEDEVAVTEALAHFTHLPATMAQSLENISCVLALLALEGLHCPVTPLDIFRGKREATRGLLEALRSKYDPGSEEPLLAKQDATKQDITKQDIVTDWARTVCEHTESLRESGPGGGGSWGPGSDQDTGFIESTGSGGNRGSSDNLLHNLRSQDESYQNIDVIEVEEKLVRADSKIAISHSCNRRACVYVSISMKYQVTDVAARDSFVKQAATNYRLLDCEVPAKDLHKLSLGYLNLLVTCSYTRSLRTKSVGIFSPYLLGLQTINIAENRQLFAHILRGRVRITALQGSAHLNFTMHNVSGCKIHVMVPEGTVWQQTEVNGDSHVVMREIVVRELGPGEAAEVSVPYLLLNKQGGGARDQPLALTPFIFRGPLSDQERVFNYSDPGEEGLFRFCEDCRGVIYRGLYGVKYYNKRPYHMECGPPCSKCGLNSLNLIIKDHKPYCSLECYYLSQATLRYCTRCRCLLGPSEGGTQHRPHCPKPCRLCTMRCLDFEGYPGPLCSKICQDWDTLKNRLCQGCGHPIPHQSPFMEVDKMWFHSVHCFRARSTDPPLIIQRAMVRGKHHEVQELRRLVKLEFEKRSHRRREALRLKMEEGERKHNLQHVMDCINKIEDRVVRSSSTLGAGKYGTLQLPRKARSQPVARTRSYSSAGVGEQVLGGSRKRSDTRELSRSISETGSFLDLLFSSDEETDRQYFTRATPARESQRSRKTIDIEKRKLNRGFPTGVRQPRQYKAKVRSRSDSSAESDTSDTVLIAPSRPSKRFLSLKRSAWKGSTGSTTSSSPLSPSSCSPLSSPTVEFERPNLFAALRCEQGARRHGEVRRAVSHNGNRDPGSNGRPGVRRVLSHDPAKHYRSAPKQSTFNLLFQEEDNGTSHPTPSPTTSATTISTRTRLGSDPLSSYTKNRPEIIQIGSSATLPPPHKTMTEAQRRYERRFSRSRSKSHSAEDEAPPPPPPPPAVTYPAEVLETKQGYSLQMIEREQEKVWTSPRIRATPLV